MTTTERAESPLARDTIYTHGPGGRPLPVVALGPEQTLLEALRAALEELEYERRRADYWRRKTSDARSEVSEATRCRAEMADERDALKEAVTQFLDLHLPRTPAVKRRYAEDERGWNMRLQGLVLAAAANWREESDPVRLCEVCEGHGGTETPEDDWVECLACDGEGEVSR